MKSEKTAEDLKCLGSKSRLIPKCSPLRLEKNAKYMSLLNPTSEKEKVSTFTFALQNYLRPMVIASTLSLACVTSYPSLASDLDRISGAISLPNSPNSYNYDEIQTSEGTRCHQGISNGKSFEFGVAGTDASNTVAYARLIVPIGKKPKRIDCSRVYELEIQRLKAELEIMKYSMEIE